MYLGDFPPLNFAKTVGRNGGDKAGAHIVSKTTIYRLKADEIMLFIFPVFFFFFKRTHAKLSMGMHFCMFHWPACDFELIIFLSIYSSRTRLQ